ncbi:MAG: hypothetical protein ACXVCS_07230, partial [Bdellovibrionota bacterium]
MELKRERPDVARWFLHAQGNTLGPYRDHDVLSGLRSGEILPNDKIYSAKDGTWTPLELHPYFARFDALIGSKRADDLAPLPSPRRLRSRAAVSVPPLPAPVQPQLQPQPQPQPIEAEKPAVIEVISPPVEEIVEVAPVAVAPEPAPEPEPIPTPLPVEAAPEFPAVAQPAVVVPVAEILEEESLEDMAVALEKALDAADRVESIPEAAPVSPIPARPEIKPVFLADPAPWSEFKPATTPAREQTRVIKIELKLPEGAVFKAIALLVLVGLAVAAGYWVSENKTRDLKDSRLSDPSSPITVPSEVGDPVPPLKAPTRPQR